MLLVCALVMLAQVQAHTFVIIGYPEARDCFNDGQKNISSNDRDNPSANNRDELNLKLAGIAEEETIIARGVYSFGGKETCRQCSPGSTNAVHAYYV